MVAFGNEVRLGKGRDHGWVGWLRGWYDIWKLAAENGTLGDIVTLGPAPLTPSFEWWRRMRRKKVELVWTGVKANMGKGRVLGIVVVLVFGSIVDDGREGIG